MAAALSLLAHGLLFLAFLQRSSPPQPDPPPPLQVALTPSLSLAQSAVSSAAPAAAAKPRAQSRAAAVARAVQQPLGPRRREAATPRMVEASAADTPGEATAPPGGSAPGLTGEQFGMARGIGDGPPAGPCDMARRVQAALRRDGLVRSELAHAQLSPTGVGRTLLLWSGDWVQGSGEEGKGLAAVREAIIWEVGFAPEACRSEQVSGYLLLTLDDQPGAIRLALGSPSWRWSDLLGVQARSSLAG